MSKIRVAVSGIGFIGAVHIEQLRRLPNVEIVALAAPRKAGEKAATYQIPLAYSDYGEMLNEVHPDAVHICSPNASHYEQVKAALARNIHVVCEKPLTTTAVEAEELWNEAEKRQLVNAVNFNYRFYPLAYEMRQQCQSEDFGQIYHIHGSYLQDWLFLDTDYSWRLESKVSGPSRAFADIGSHWADLAQFVTGVKIKEVMADFATFHLTRKKPKKSIDTYSNMVLQAEDYEEVPIDTEDYAAVLFRLENGGRASCVISQMFAGKKNELRLAVSGSRKSLLWDSSDSNHLQIGRREKANLILEKDPSLMNEKSRLVNSYPGGHVEGFADSFKQHFIKIYQAIEQGRQEDREYANFADGLNEMILCDKIIQSQRQNQWVSL